MEIVELYEDDRFNTFLEMVAEKNKIREFDDFKQDVFLDIIERGYTTPAECKRAARKIGMRYYRAAKYDDIMYYAREDDNGDLETPEEAMSRLIYEGRAVKVS